MVLEEQPTWAVVMVVRRRTWIWLLAYMRTSGIPLILHSCLSVFNLSRHLILSFIIVFLLLFFLSLMLFVRGTTIWLATTTLKTDSRGVMSNAIKDLSVSSSSPISFEMEWHNSWSDTLYSIFFFPFLFFSPSLFFFFWLQESFWLLQARTIPLNTYLPRHLRDCWPQNVMGLEVYMEFMGLFKETDIQ